MSRAARHGPPHAGFRKAARLQPRATGRSRKCRDTSHDRCLTGAPMAGRPRHPADATRSSVTVLRREPSYRGRRKSGGCDEETKAMAFKNDMTWMYVMHDALRRELECIARAPPRPDAAPKQVRPPPAGWEMFKPSLRIPPPAEDDMLWPPMRQALADNSDGLALLDAMEAEHAA